MEGFFGMLQREQVNRRIYQTRREARADIFDDIDRFYNQRCRRRLQEAKQQDLFSTQPSVLPRGVGNADESYRPPGSFSACSMSERIPGMASLSISSYQKSLGRP